MPKVTVLPKEICKVRTFFKNEKNAGKIMMTIDKPQLKGKTQNHALYKRSIHWDTTFSFTCL